MDISNSQLVYSFPAHKHISLVVEPLVGMVFLWEQHADINFAFFSCCLDEPLLTFACCCLPPAHNSPAHCHLALLPARIPTPTFSLGPWPKTTVAAYLHAANHDCHHPFPHCCCCWVFLLLLLGLALPMDRHCCSWSLPVAMCYCHWTDW